MYVYIYIYKKPKAEYKVSKYRKVKGVISNDCSFEHCLLFAIRSSQIYNS